MRQSFWHLSRGIIRHGWGFFVLVALDFTGAIHWLAGKLGYIVEISPMIGWGLLALGIVYAVWRTYHDLWLSLSAEERAAIGYVKSTDAPSYLLNFIDEGALKQWDGDQHFTKAQWASIILDDITKHKNIDIYERLSETRFRKIDYEDAEKQSFQFGEEASNTFYVRKSDLKRGWRLFMGKSIKQRFHRLLKVMARGKPTSQTPEKNRQH